MHDRLTPSSDDRIASFLFPLIIRAAVDDTGRIEVARRLGFDLVSMQSTHGYVGGPTGPRSMWGELVRFTGNPLIGWEAGGRVELGAFGPFYALLKSAPTFGAALQMVIRFADTLDTTRAPQLRVENGRGVFQWRTTSVATYMQDTDFRLRVGFRIAESILPQFRLSRVHNPHQPPADVLEHYHSEYERVFGCPVVFGAELPTLEFDAELLNQNLHTADSLVHDVARGQMNAIKPHRPGDHFRQQLSEVYREGISSGKCELTDIAARLEMSPSVFRTKLRSVGTNHREQCQRARIELAESLLRNPNMTMSQVGARLGYNSATAFAKAFRRWTGTSPSAFRRSISH